MAGGDGNGRKHPTGGPGGTPSPSGSHEFGRTIPIDPATDARAHYDHSGGSVDYPGIVRDLRERVSGDVKFDTYTRELYATDASAYEVTPIGVVYPTSTDDVATIMSYCASEELPVLPRGGGTSLAGQSVNEAVVLDFTRYMDDIVDIDPSAETARVQPGLLLGDLNAAVEAYDLKFAPDPAWGDKSAIGGAIGNNSTGSHSLKYGKTDAYIERCEVVLADGTVTEFGEMTVRELRQKAAAGAGRSAIEADIYEAAAEVLDEEDAIKAAYPSLKRNVSGYNLDALVRSAAQGTVNVGQLLAGSEGTLAIVTEATVALEPVPETKAMALLRYDGLADAMADVEPILDHDPAAVEVLDDVLLDLARESAEFGDLVTEMVPEGTGAVLLVEFYAEDDSHGKQLVADLLADRIPEAIAQAVPTEGAQDITAAQLRATSADEAHDQADRARFWKLRKSGLPILLSRTSDAKHISFIEDVAVDPTELPDFVADFQEILDDNGTFASFYGHAGPGCLHIRPLIDTKSIEGLDRMESIATAVSDLAVEYDGSISGEHGDGRARTQWNRKQYGQDVWELFRDLKTAFDPDWLLNPGQVCGYAPDEDMAGAPDRAQAVRLTENLRFSPDYEATLGFEPQLHWTNENGMQGMVELCHGCGGCRGPQETTGGVMCPTYRAATEEVTSTRGRANALRQVMSGDIPDDPADSELMAEVMDLCIGCKGCAHDCPSGVDMAKLKAELQYHQHDEGRPSLRDRLFANVERVSAIGSALSPLPSYLQSLPGSSRLTEALLGIARERDLPTFRRETFADWASERDTRVSSRRASETVLLVPDTYTNYTNPAVGRAAVRLLEALGCHVEVADTLGATGRAAFSKGFLTTARKRAARTVEALEPAVAEGWDVVCIEPSDAVMLQSDYGDLLGGDASEQIAPNSFGVCEYIDRRRLTSNARFDGNAHLVYHGHCHQKATKRDHHAVAVLRQAGYTVDALDSGCCGMAGSFGYEAEHYSMSEAIGRILGSQIAESDGELVVAPGASCRTQIDDLHLGGGPPDAWATLDLQQYPPHPVEMLALALDSGTVTREA